MTILPIDTISQRFALRSRSRHQSVHQEAGATPIAGGETSQSHFLFLQSFQSGSIAPKQGADAIFTLTLEHGLGQTVYFSDRPERIVGSAPTPKFLDGLGFGADNPPNAALVIDSGDGEVDIAVVELTNPTYDEASFTATYDISVLQDYDKTVDLEFQKEPSDLGTVPASFGSTHLFIDDCPDRQVYCHYADESAPPESIGMVGFCWSWSQFECKFCDYDAAVNKCYSDLQNFCTDHSPACTPIAD